MKDDVFVRKIAQLEDRFQEMDSDITTSLFKSDEQYAALRTRRCELQEQFPFIESVLDGEGEVRLTAEEHHGLVEYIRTMDNSESMERLNLYLAGHKDCICYLKKIGLL